MNSTKKFIVDSYKGSKKSHHPLVEGGFLNQWLFLFANKVIKAGSIEPFQFDMLFSLDPSMECSAVIKDLKSQGFDPETYSPKEKFTTTLTRYVAPIYWKTQILLFFADIVTIPLPFLIEYFLQWYHEQAGGLLQGLLLCSSICLITFLVPTFA